MHTGHHARTKKASALPRRGYSVREVCEMLGIGNTTAWKLIKEGRIVAVKVAGRTVVTAASVEALLAPPSADAA
jgi:excisionase family DNA binding protein